MEVILIFWVSTKGKYAFETKSKNKSFRTTVTRLRPHTLCPCESLATVNILIQCMKASFLH